MILVTGIPRSGTTWTAKILSSPENILHFYEPDNEHNNLLGFVNKQKAFRFPYLTKNKGDKGIYNIYSSVLQGKYLFGYSKCSLIIKKLLRITIDNVEKEIDQKERKLIEKNNSCFQLSTVNKLRVQLTELLLKLSQFFKS